MTRTILLTVLLVAGSTALPATPGDPYAAGPSVVSGAVRDRDSARPIGGAQVFLRGTPFGVLTDAAGRYRIEADLPAGTAVTIVVRVLGYVQATREVEWAASLEDVDFELSRTTVRLEEVTVSGREREADDSRSALRRSNQAVTESGARYAPATVAPTRSLAGARQFHTESYARIEENGWRHPIDTPLSTFSIDVDRASYSNVRRFLHQGQRPPVDAVRIEELINYFPYDDPDARGEHPFTVTTELGEAPWNRRHRLVRVGVQGRRVDLEDLPPANLVFLLDVSGSMAAPNKLPLVQRSMRMLVDALRPEDRVAIVVYAGAAGLVLESTPASHRHRILHAIERLHAGGSTAGGAGIRLAYDVATRHFIEGGNNRVILATDGDFNVGPSSDGEMTRLIEEKRESGVFLSVLGYGMGNLKDSKMEALAHHGNGSYAYIDNLLEARKVLVTELGGTLLTIAKDVKIQVEFNPAVVQSYRLIGYENRLLAAEDFNDDRKDAGELGAGHSVTALYEIVPVGTPLSDRPTVDPLRYRDHDSGSGRGGRSARDRGPSRGDHDELMFIKLRYKAPDGDTSRLIQQPVSARMSRPSENFRFAASVAAFGMLLRDSEHVGDFTLMDVARLARGAVGDDPHGYRSEFVRLVEVAGESGVLVAGR